MSLPPKKKKMQKERRLRLCVSSWSEMRIRATAKSDELAVCKLTEVKKYVRNANGINK